MLKTVSSITNAIGALNYKGTWNASTNSPALASGVGTKGDYYVVSVAGSTNLDGETLWGVGDWAVFNGAAWQKVEGGNTINATTVSASTSVTTPIVQSSTSAGTTLKNASGTTCIQYGAGGGTNVTIEAAINMNGANAHIEMSPTGTGHVTINPTAVGDMDNMVIGATVPKSIKGTTITATGIATFSAGTAAAPAITTTGDTNTGIFFPAADTIAFSEGGAEAMRIDSSGNVGLGVTPSTWQTGTKAIEIGSTGSALYSYASNFLILVNNATYNGTNWIYSQSGQSPAYYALSGGQHQWNIASSGTAGNSVTFTQAMTLFPSGGVSIGNTTDKGAGSLNVSGLIFPQQATTASAPAYQKGAIYFDTTLNKLRVGGATAWETITSV